MVLLRHFVGDALRRLRLRQGRTLREVSAAARVSLGYLSEVERGQKEASSELLASICGALGAPLSQLLREVSDNFALAELQNEPVFSGIREPSLNAAAGHRHGDRQPGRLPAGRLLTQRPQGQARSGAPVPAARRLVLPAGQRVGAASGRGMPSAAEPLRGDAPLDAGVLDPARLDAAGLKAAGIDAAGLKAAGRDGSARNAKTLDTAPLDPSGLPLAEPQFDQVTRSAQDITNMVPV